MRKKRVKRDPWFSDKPRRRQRRSKRSGRRGLSPTERVGAEAFSGKLD